VIAFSRRIADSSSFQNFIIAVIVLTAAVIGLETSDALTERYGGVFHAIDTVVQVIFMVEIAIRLLACWPRLLGFFRDGWNVFDFAVVVASLLPQAGAFAMVARLARLMQVTRLISTFPELRLIIGTMLRRSRRWGT
jgi:voltage-gated sodium channel